MGMLTSMLSPSNNSSVGTLTVSGTAVFKGPVQMESTLSLSGAAVFNTTLNVQGALTADSTLTVSGAATFKSNASLGANLTVAGTSTLSGAVVANTTLNVQGATTLDSTLSVSGAAVFQGGAHIDGALSVSGDAVITGNLSFENLTVGGTSSLSGAATLKTTLNVEGATTLSGAATFKSIVTAEAGVVAKTTLLVEGNSTFSGAALFNTTVTLSGNAVAKSNFLVEGTTTLSGNAVAKGTLLVEGVATLSAGAVASGEIYTSDAFVAGVNSGNDITLNGTAYSSLFMSDSNSAGDVFGIASTRHTDTASLPAVKGFMRSRGTHGSETIVQNNDALGALFFAGFDGADYALAARIDCYVNGTPGTNDMPGRLVISTSPDGTQAPLEVMHFRASPSAVNYIQASNNTTTNAPFFLAQGTDASVGLNLATKNGAVAILDGTTTASAPLRFVNAGNTGYIGLKAPEVTTPDTDFVLPSADGSASAPLVTDGSGNLSFGNPLANPNIIIGGDFGTNPWQRGTTFTSIVSGDFAADRFSQTNNTTAVYDILKTADAPTASEAGVYTSSCFNLDVTTADGSIAAGEISTVRYKVEGYDIAKAGFGQSGTRYVTLSFWHKHTVTGTYCVAFRNGANDRSYIAEYTQSTTDTWEKATITLAVDTTGTWLYTNGNGLELQFSVACGSTFQTTANTWTAGNYLATSNQVNGLSSTSNFFKLALVKLELGQVATPFPVEDRATVMAKCQRYFCKSFGVDSTPADGLTGNRLAFSCQVANANGSNSMAYDVRFPQPMRASPTITFYNMRGAGTSGQWDNGAASLANATTDNVSANGGLFYDSGATMAAGRWYIQYTSSAEL